MPLNLIPPKEKGRKKKSNIGVLALKKAKDPEKLIYIVGILIVIFLMGSFYLIVKTHKAGLEKQLANAEQEAKDLTQEIRKIKAEGELTDFQTKLDIVEQLINSHKYWLTNFNLVESVALPKVQFTSFKSNASQSKLILSAQTTDFRKMAEQMIVLRKNECMKEVELNGFSMKEGGISFKIEAQLLDEAWQKNGCQVDETNNNES